MRKPAMLVALLVLTAAGPPTPVTEPTNLTAADKQRDAARVPLATAVVTAFPNWDGFFSSLVANYAPDGKHFVFGSLRDGVPEIYLGDADQPAAQPRAVTSGPERAIWARYTVDGKAILYLRDEKGNEQHHIWRINPDGTALTDLTPGTDPLQRGEPLLPRKKPDTMFYGGSRTTSPEVQVFGQSVAGGPARLVYTHPNPGGLGAVTSDGTRGLFVDFRSQSEAV